jgi:serine/threonine-protein kinase
MKHVRETPRPMPDHNPPPERANVHRALAQNAPERRTAASPLAAVARQAASALANTAQQPAGAAQPVRAAGASPVSPAARPHSGAAAPHSGSAAPHSGSAAPHSGSAAPGSPITGSARPPYPPVPRPVSGARGAASVPSGPPVQPYRPPYGAPAQPASTAKPESSAGRQVLIVLAVVLALLVLLCAGVISFLYKQGKQKSSALSDRPVTAVVVHTGTADNEPLAASYRLTRQAGAKPGWTRNEGRQTL